MKKGSWEVILECTVRKCVICDDCTEEEARNETWDYAVDEREIEQIDWTVEQVRPNA